MKIIFLANLFPDKIKKEIELNSIGSVQYAANAFQWNFVRGLDQNNDCAIKIINAPLVGSYPFSYKKLSIKKHLFAHAQNATDTSVAFLNFAIIKHYFVRKALVRELIKNVEHNQSESQTIVVYGMLPPWVLAAIKIKEKYPIIKLCLIVPDLPEYMSDPKRIFYKIREYFIPNLYSYISKFDSFVFMTDAMAEHFKITDKKWVTIEGMVDPNEINIQSTLQTLNKKIVMYAGTLSQRFGIVDLLDAFQQIEDPHYELWICGSGDGLKEIVSKSLLDIRIKVLGLLPREQVLELQKKATVLVNPRNSKGEYTKYSFPSKTMEYLLSGTPCIMKPLPGIPDEYYQYLFLVDNDSIVSLRNKIIEVCSFSEEKLEVIGKSAQKFVLEKKNYTFQTKKMIDMFKK